ncbi:cysteine--tRNA ligase [Candidatus Giovannonibacteria bacterium RIFCSPLOWO2_02_FULL_43_11b]|uniref:Cysteine--tRNA ligase n=1 Tax=Candidatus Giovannonibacteria bacterium RIFCSPHIGHO2_12_FULL_43_15 TaxID=1798341 RepID=A0A1F5WQM4_9BACT|nr:MAG: cysteine--tRNA ligase [Candidatus Giovannonibacteria bacterium RIFCSPHIGHO2_01_FULL_43_100]OGF67812.1 MAG: cysteine--tRNA ligase [Candidatus Giovannonibacteria bacterium RIFCSPHIGHO2_02_FULL_43_32]OGF77972.1 MAG: cysteine--tRNA ligase [Candidatus Giovannonibacteria bacterium RIFCSPHIGHO2_12_FULL_43_15]OGF79493.1 MAG: cysteine--tRNA ligase [Candidatus Giovannonibacteria bacterium RIFCSPLOWO2_01_FULL_43_60]OGF89223.1 MAG: cysteine--tRNA ligase [Candidatus Giovannonibacteria bacterium RIFC
MPLRLFNALSRKKEIFKPSKGKSVSFYACGPTVYNYVHIGNLRTSIFNDLLRRVLELSGYKVKEIMNITDVDDKTIKGSRDAGQPIKDFTRYYEKEFLSDVKSLNIIPATKYTRATEHIKEMVDIIKILLEKEYAYKSGDGVYFDISKFKSYGKLSRLKKQNLKTGARVNNDEYEKDSARDFALWKFKKEDEPSWPSPFGSGRPGWHVECSAMSVKYLGMPIDIHTGGVDLIFPHHENEIAQSEAAYGKKFVRFFVEGEMMSVEGHKMSKSLKNTFTLRDLGACGFEPLDFRYLTLTAHYRSPLSFTWGSLSAARNARKNLAEKTLAAPKSDKKVLRKFWEDFLSAVNDDLNIPKALALVWKAVGKDEILFADKILGLGLGKLKKIKAGAKLEKLIKEREVLRSEKKWREADSIRNKILAEGYIIEDTPMGARIKKAG